MSNKDQGPARPKTMRHRLANGMIAAGAMVVLAGCAGTTGVAAPPSPIPPVAAPAESPRPNPLAPVPAIPAVTNPRDVTAVSTRPCELLAAAQVTGFRLDLPPDQLTGLHGSLRCMWTKTTIPDRAIVRLVSVSMSTTSPAFEVAYERDRGLPFFELTDIAGYPAIVTRTNAKSPTCAIRIEVAEHQNLSVDYEDKDLTKNPQQSCDVGKKVATAMVMNVPLKG